MTLPVGVVAPAPTRPRSVPGLLATGLLHVALVALAASALAPGRTVAPAARDEQAGMLVYLAQDTTDARQAGAPHAPAAPAAAGAPAAGSRPAGRAPAEADADARYVSGHTLEIGPLPAGSPDFSRAADHPVLAGAVVLRVYVSTFGPPDRVEVRGTPNDLDFARELRLALERTSFLPGRLRGHDVAAYVDYEFRAGIVSFPIAQYKPPA